MDNIVGGKMYFYNKNMGFYKDTIHGDNIPKDAVLITEETYINIMNGQADGGIISSDEKGYPIIVPAPLSDPINIAKSIIASRREETDYIIAPLQDAIDEGIATEEEIFSIHQWKKYRVNLNRIPKQKGFPENIEWPEKPDL